jgi:hypothetical protein
MASFISQSQGARAESYPIALLWHASAGSRHSTARSSQNQWSTVSNSIKLITVTVRQHHGTSVTWVFRSHTKSTLFGFHHVLCVRACVAVIVAAKSVLCVRRPLICLTFHNNWSTGEFSKSLKSDVNFTRASCFRSCLHEGDTSTIGLLFSFSV